MVSSYSRGHKIVYINRRWVYADDLTIAAKIRPCQKCGIIFEENKSDKCIGNIKHVKNACCGHGIKEEAYIQFKNGLYICGWEAILFFRTRREVMQQGSAKCWHCGKSCAGHFVYADYFCADCIIALCEKMIDASETNKLIADRFNKRYGGKMKLEQQTFDQAQALREMVKKKRGRK